MIISGPIAEQAVAELKSGRRTVDDGTIEAVAAHATENGRSAEAIARHVGARVQVEPKLPRGVLGLRLKDVILVAPLRSLMTRDVVVTHEGGHGVLRLAKLAHQHADVWAVTIAMAIPLRCLCAMRELSPVAVAAELGVPCWMAWVRLQMESVTVSLGSRILFSSQTY